MPVPSVAAARPGTVDASPALAHVLGHLPTFRRRLRTDSDELMTMLAKRDRIGAERHFPVHPGDSARPTVACRARGERFLPGGLKLHLLRLRHAPGCIEDLE